MTMAQAGSQAAFQAVDFDAVLTVAGRPTTAGRATHCGMVSALGADAPAFRRVLHRVKARPRRP